MKPDSPLHPILYPIHVCHETTLPILLSEFAVLHFRDFMALQVMPTAGLTACTDRMGDLFSQLIPTGWLVYGDNGNGPPPADVIKAVDLGLIDPSWRATFDRALRTDRRFQLGLFESRAVPRTSKPDWATVPLDVDGVKTLRGTVLAGDGDFEYALTLATTFIPLVYTYRLVLLFMVSRRSQALGFTTNCSSVRASERVSC